MDRYECTLDDPWTPDKGKRAQHPDAKRISGDDNYFESFSVYKCPYCETEFTIYYEE